jgi:hypothetical protein
MFPDTYTVLPEPLTTTALLKLAPLVTGTRSMLISAPYRRLWSIMVDLALIDGIVLSGVHAFPLRV